MALITIIINTLPIILERWFKYLLEMKYVFLLLSYRSYHVMPHVITYLQADPGLNFSPDFWVHSHNPALNTIFRQNQSTIHRTTWQSEEPCSCLSLLCPHQTHRQQKVHITQSIWKVKTGCLWLQIHQFSRNVLQWELLS